MSSSSDAGFTGLEAAIVLIALVIVAAVFGFVILQAGFTSAQQGQSVIHDGMEQAGSSCMVSGIVYGISARPGVVESFVIPVGLTAGSEPIDMATVSVRFTGPGHSNPISRSVPLADTFPKPGYWSIQERVNSDDNLLLEPGERFILNVSPEVWKDCQPYGSFAIEIKPPGRAALRVERKIPGSIERVNRLE